MYKYFLFIAFLFTTTFGMAQSTGIIKGRVVDSITNKPIEFATVVVSDAVDTTANYISYTLTDKTGSFALHKLPAGTLLKLLITFVANQPFRQKLTLRNDQTTDLGSVKLSSKELGEVLIKGERVPIIIKKDTVEFNAEAFKTRPNADVEALLKKLPGMEVNNNGSMIFIGKDVSKIQVDGRDFFANDMRIASKNLDAEMIDKVQIYDDRENDPNHLIPDNQVKKIINLKFKKALKKSIFGKVNGGKGTNDHYQGSGLINMFRDTLQVSLLGLSNNLNSTGFDFNDLYQQGGIMRGGQSTFAGSVGGFGSAPSGKQTTTLGGVNINADYGKKLKINLAYLYNRVANDMNTITDQQQLINDTTAATHTNNRTRNTTATHNISGTLRWQSDDRSTMLEYTPSVRISEDNRSSGSNSFSFSNYVPEINDATTSNYSSGSSFQFQQSLTYNRQFKKPGTAFTLSHSLNISPGSSYSIDDQSLTSFVTTLPSFTYSRRGDNTDRTANGNISVEYRYPVSKKLTVDVAAITSYSNNLNKVATYDYNPATGQYDNFLQIQSSDLSRRIFVNSLNPGATYNFTQQFSVNTHLRLQSQVINDSFGRGAANATRNYFNLLPTVFINYKSISAQYERNMIIPNVGDLIPYSVVFSPLFSVSGNPNLLPTFRNSLSLNYGKYDFQSGLNYRLGASYSYEENAILRQRTISKDLVETSTPINRDGRYNYALTGSLSKRFKKTNDIEFSINSSMNANYNRDFFVLNYQNGFQNSYSVNLSQAFQFSWKGIITFAPQYNISGVLTRYSGFKSNGQNYVQHSLVADVGVTWPKHFYIQTNYTYRYNPLAPSGFQKSSNLLNMSIARQFLKKDRGELKLSCYDLLNQNVGITRSVIYNTVTDTQAETIKRYFMLSLLFKFNKSTSK